jgi:hypothetical protein
MQTMVRDANAHYNQQRTYTPKQKPAPMDTNPLKNALENTKVPISVLHPI